MPLNISVSQDDFEFVIELATEAVENMEDDGDECFKPWLERWERITKQFYDQKQAGIQHDRRAEKS